MFLIGFYVLADIGSWAGSRAATGLRVINFTVVEPQPQGERIAREVDESNALVE